MKELENKNISKGEKTMLTAIIFSAPGPIATGIPAILSKSATQIADFIRRTTELIAIIISWIVYKKIHKSEEDLVDKEKLIRFSNLAITLAMILSGITMFAVGIARLFTYNASGKVIIGLITAIMGTLFNSFFALRYKILVSEHHNPIIERQYKLYKAKAYVDLVVLVALATVFIAPNSQLARYVDAIGCIMVAIYLIYNGIKG